jgi:hypothetical protein
MRRVAVIVSLIGVLICGADAAYAILKGTPVVPTRSAALVPFLLALTAFKFSSARWLAAVAVGINALWAFIGFFILFFGVLFGNAPPGLPVGFIVAVAVFWNFLPGVINVRALRQMKDGDEPAFRL